MNRCQVRSSAVTKTQLRNCGPGTYVREDTFGVVRYLRQAYEQADSDFPPHISAMTIRSKADPELHRMLDKIGVPRFE